MKPLPLVAAWRNAVRDSNLDPTAKLVAHTLTTYMDATGKAFPGKPALAEGSSIDKRTVDRALSRIEARGLLRIERTKGGRQARGKAATNRYTATIPTVALVPPLTMAGETPLQAPN